MKRLGASSCRRESESRSKLVAHHRCRRFGHEIAGEPFQFLAQAIQEADARTLEPNLSARGRTAHLQYLPLLPIVAPDQTHEGGVAGFDLFECPLGKLDHDKSA